MKLRNYFSLGAIIGTLPAQIVDGQIADAAPVMANFNFIVAQVNANAAAGGTSISQWQSIGVAPTFLSANSLSVPGDLRSVLNIGRRILAVVTAGAFAYGTVQQSVFGGGVTTLTLNMSSGVIDVNLSSLNYGIIVGNVNSSLPVSTDFIAGFDTQISLPASSTTIILQSAPSTGDALGEWSVDANARFSPAYSGNYQVSVNGWLFTNGANVTLGQAFSLQLFIGGVMNATFSTISSPFASGVQSNWLPFSGDYCPNGGIANGTFADIRIATPGFTTANVLWLGSARFRRLPY